MQDRVHGYLISSVEQIAPEFFPHGFRRKYRQIIVVAASEKYSPGFLRRLIAAQLRVINSVGHFFPPFPKQAARLLPGFLKKSVLSLAIFLGM